MAGNNVEIKVGVNVDGAPSLGALSTSLEKTAQTANRLGDESVEAAGSIAKAGAASQTAAASTRQLGAGMDSAAEQISRAKGELLALVGVGAGLSGIKDLSEVADSFKNLEAKIKLVTGEGKAFDDAFEGVFEIAKRTNSAVEETGVLFTKLAEAGKGLGVSQAEALKLTETINQAIQVSGASAGASGAAIQQLVQGLQSGVLRGDEFNSVMEQAPRLAKALADGLGVGTGELRNMAEQGRLTSETVIKSLQGQSDAVQAEFGKLPATVGRAMQNLSTEFTRYIGEADKAGGYSAKLAGIIDSLAGNLSTVATVMIKVGQSVAALKLLSMAQDWLSAGAAIRATTVATEQHTISTAKNTAAKGQNTAAVIANTQAQIANAQGINTASSAAEKASGVFGMFGKTLGTLFLVDFALNFKQYGTAIGEWAAKMMGAKDRTQELADAEKRATAQAEEAAAMRKRQAVALEEAREKTFELSKQAKDLTAKFDELRSKGDSAADAIRSIGKDFDLSNVEGVRNAGAVLDTLQAKGKLTADEFATAWTDALKGIDLGTLEVQARAAFAGTAREAERMAQVLDASAREAIRRTGLDFELISGGMGKASRMAINDTQAIIDGLDRLKGQGVDVGQALTASLGKSIKEAQTDKALAEVRQQIEQVRSTLGQQVADGLLQQAEKKARDLKTALEDITPSIQSAKEAMRLLGVTSDESLRETANKAREAYQAMKESGTASARELRDGFTAYAEAAIKANNGVADGVLIGEAAVRGLRIEAGEAGATITSAMSSGAAATDGLTGSVQSSTQAFREQGAAASRTAEEIGRMVAAKAGFGVVSKEQTDKANKDYQAMLDRYSGKGNEKSQGDRLMEGTPIVGSDNSLPFIMRDKLQKGTLTEDDIKNMDLVAKITRSNVASMQSLGAFRSLAGTMDDYAWLNTARQLEEQSEKFKQQIALREAKQSLGITSQEQTDKKNSAASYLMAYKSTLSEAERKQLEEKTKGMNLKPYQNFNGKIPKFASGGYHKGGIRLVGEDGPELEVTGASRIINASDTRSLLKEAAAPMTIAPLMQSTAAAQNANSSGKTYTVHINLNGKTTTVNTSTDDDAQRLIDVLRSAKMAAGG
jgi:tape measure domain-containing protein